MQHNEALYLSLLVASKDAFALRLFLAAYHALSAALLCAVSLRDTRKVTEIEYLAEAHYGQLQQHLNHSSGYNEPYELGLYHALTQLATSQRVLLEEVALPQESID